MIVSLMTLRDENEYRAFLSRMPRALFYSSLEFRDLIEGQLGQKSCYLVLKEGQSIHGVLPCFIKENPRFGNVLNSLPFFGSNGGILMEDGWNTAENRTLLLGGFLDLAREHSCISAVIITSPWEEDHELYRTCLKPEFMDQRIGQITELREDPLETLSSMRRRGVLKAKKAGLKVRIEQAASEDDLRRFYEMHCSNMERVSGIRKEYPMVQALNECPCSRIIFAEDDRMILAGLLCLYFNQTVEYYIPVFDEDNKNSHALSLAICEGMDDAYRNGHRFWNFGGTWLSQEGVHTFKQHFGAADRPYYYYVKLFKDVEYFRAMGREGLLREYPHCYVIPFGEIEKEG